MLDSILKLIEYLTQFVRERERTHEEFLSRYVLPVYQLSELVFRDYLELLQSIRRRIENGDDAESIIRFLEDGRVKYLPARMKLRAILQHQNRIDVRLGKFELGILLLLTGGLAAFEEGYITTFDGRGAHTLLDILYVFHVWDAEIERGRWLIAVDDQRQTLEKAWKEIVEAVTEMQLSHVPVPPNTSRP